MPRTAVPSCRSELKRLHKGVSVLEADFADHNADTDADRDDKQHEVDQQQRRAPLPPPAAAHRYGVYALRHS